MYRREGSSTLQRREEEGDDIGDKAKGCLSSGGRRSRGDQGGASYEYVLDRDSVSIFAILAERDVFLVDFSVT